jgi:hypothetical protein
MTAVRDESLHLVVRDQAEARRAAMGAYALCKSLTADGKLAIITAAECADARSIQQNAFYWGIVLRDIAQQAMIEGRRYIADAWHEHFKRTFLGYQFKRVVIAGRKRKAVIQELRSTTKLSVKKMSMFLEQVIAFAVTDLGVRFTETRWEDHR